MNISEIFNIRYTLIFNTKFWKKIIYLIYRLIQVTNNLQIKHFIAQSPTFQAINSC